MSTFIAQLSPIAAKLYLALHLYPDPNASPPIAHVSLTTLAANAGMSKRSCSAALRELITHQLITRLPAGFHTSARYQIHPFPNAQPAAPFPPDAHPVAPLTTPQAQPAATPPAPQAHPAAPVSYTTPVSATKTPQAQPAALPSPFAHTPDEEALLSNPAVMQLLLSSLTPDEKAQVVTAAQATLARLDAMESHP